MFTNISQNEKTISGKSVNALTLKNYIHQNPLGLPEWQQNWNSTNKNQYYEKNVTNLLTIVS